MDKKIYEKLAAVQKEIGAIEKARENRGQGFKFRGIDDVYNELHPLFVQHGIIFRSEILREHQVELPRNDGKYAFTRTYIIRYHLVACEDGSEVWTDVAGEGADTQDKGSNKAMSAGHKYAILQMFTVPTEETDDPDETNGDQTERDALLVQYRQAIAAKDDWSKEQKEAYWRGAEKQSSEFIRTKMEQLKNG